MINALSKQSCSVIRKSMGLWPLVSLNHLQIWCHNRQRSCISLFQFIFRNQYFVLTGRHFFPLFDEPCVCPNVPLWFIFFGPFSAWLSERIIRLVKQQIDLFTISSFTWDPELSSGDVNKRNVSTLHLLTPTWKKSKLLQLKTRIKHVTSVIETIFQTKNKPLIKEFVCPTT